MSEQPGPESCTEPDKFTQLMRAVQAAMRAEQIPEMTVERVVNRVLYGDPAPAARAARRKREAGQVVHVHVNAPPGMDPAHLAAAVRANGQRIRWDGLSY